ncbi:aldo/keto reductase [Acinetobacter lactucae]|uniref:Aldo/keto reductase n=1 Tax=Acinetobacter lactucae TaxID=1785128 RepID=A0A429K472_9GAMM|nr:aldo/keto reductase [Acinetobacter lactucae]RSO58819.1 aldo/keto reductase [Acinetobacter lactucae]
MDQNILLPDVSLGVYRMSNDTAKKSVLHALSMGYKGIDTASFYGNERGVGDAVRESGLNRESIYITTKIWNSDQGEFAMDALKRSLDKLGLDYVDSYLLHWPVKGKFLKTWEILQEGVERGYIRYLGVSNFTEDNLDYLIKYSGIKPSVNQIEIHPYLSQEKIVNYNKKLLIETSAWSPFGSGLVLNDKKITSIAKKYSKSVSQIILKWLLNRGIKAIPKASTPLHIKQNIDIYDFELDIEDIDLINSCNRNIHTDWNPYRDVYN